MSKASYENPTSPRMTSMHQAENPSNSPMLLTFEQKTLSHVVNPGEGPLLHESHIRDLRLSG